MNSGFTLEPREGYLYVHLAPGFEMTPESKLGVWTAILDACSERGFLRVLAEGDNVQRRVGPAESFGIVSLASRVLPGLSVACCFRGFVPDEQTQLFRTAAMNRGMRVEFFQDLSAALRWLGAADPPPG